MAISKDQFLSLKKEFVGKGVQLIAVSKMQPADNILKLYQWGQRDFGENYVQELVEKEAMLPKDIKWHFIGHLQSNKVKYIAPFVHLIHGVDSNKLLTEINKQAEKSGRTISILLQLHIATESTKFGLDNKELYQILASLKEKPLKNIAVTGLMGMASFTDNMEQVRSEMRSLKTIFDTCLKESTDSYQLRTLSMGMTADYKIAIEEGSTMVRIGSLLFGNRNG